MNKTRPLWKVSVTTTPEAEEAVEELLAGLFQRAVAAYTNVETGRTVVDVYLDEKPRHAALQQMLRGAVEQIAECGLNIGPGAVSICKVKREDWAESWKRHFKPIVIGKALLVKPSWIRRPLARGQKLVVLDPGLSFGTGQHPTTSFCLEQLVARRRAGTKQSVLDIGCGSGILAISAGKLGYAPVEAFDFDPEAVRVASVNARKNRVENRIRIFEKDLNLLPVKAARKYSVVCANLISNLLLSAQKRLLNRLAADGVLILAGILDVEFLSIQTAYEKAGLQLLASRTEGEWRSGAFAWCD